MHRTSPEMLWRITVLIEIKRYKDLNNYGIVCKLRKVSHVFKTEHTTEDQSC